ncbi:hypothetical protein Q672_06650 [Marinobacter sp. EVN1]|uniref:hypothetical protein n=1 Tax=Marinobacter sp. EVN1 TaxID=1397532 RepID=UPI0003B8D4E1|nr:hypothetical protein [Marinobacter sp. EVN1]ERS82000.1 hypothetical protein Q672_06650 [Marinobacter sp. EVN1]
MEWLATIFSWFFPDAVKKAEQSSAQSRHTHGLRKAEQQLQAGFTLKSISVSDQGKQEAKLSFVQGVGFSITLRDGQERTRNFESINDLDEFLVSETSFRIGDFLPR